MVSKQLIRVIMLYDLLLCFMGLSAAASCHRIRHAFWDNVVGKRNARHLFQKFKLGNQSICDEPRSGWPQILYDKALKTAIEDGNNQLCGELIERFQVSDKTV